MKRLRLFLMFLVLLVAGLCINTSVFAQLYGPNLIVNGDFSGGNSGFFTDYVFIDPEVGGANSLVPEGRYTVAANPGNFHPQFTGAPFVGEKFLIVNGATNLEICGGSPCDETWIVWQQTVEVEEDLDYEFSFWLSSLVTASPAHLSLTIEINGTPYSEVFIAPGTTNNWVQQMWTNTDKSGTATITIIETTKVKSGNDFGIDDIVFRSIEQEPFPCPPLDVTIIVTDVTCPGDDDGMIQVFMNGVKPFNICLSYGCEVDENGEFDLFDKTQTATYGGLISGWYTITIFDGNGCPFKECVYVGEPEPLMGTVTELVNPLCAGDMNGMVTIQISGGVPPYTASMGTVEGDILTISGLGEGPYNVVINDSNGCGPAEVDFVLTDPPVLEADYDATEILCYGYLSTVTVTATGGTPPYQLFDGDVLAGDFENGSITLDVPAGPYSWTVVDANGCQKEVNFVVEQPESLAIEISVVSEILCFGGEAEITVGVSGGTPPYMVTINGIEPIEVNGTFSFILLAGSYTLSVADANECEFTSEIVIEEPELLEADYEAEEIGCYGDLAEVTVFAFGGTPPYQLVDGDTFAGNFEDGEITIMVGAGEYNWTVIDGNGCEAEVSFVLTEPDPLVANLVSTEDASCYGFEDGSAVISITGGTMPYTFNMGVFADGLLVIEGLGAGDYTLVISDAKNCGPEEVDFTIGQPDEIIVEGVDVETPLCAPDNFPQCTTPWAVNWIEYEVGFSTYGNGQVAAARQNPNNALGMPDYSNSPPITFVTLGFGGHIILEAGCMIYNGEGDDFEVVETSYGQTNCSNYPEKADVYVSQNPDGPWSYLGEICLKGSLDLSNGIDKETEESFVLYWAKYIKIVDVSDPADFSSGDGFDVNGIYIFNSQDPDQSATSVTINYSGVNEGDEPQFIIYEGDEVILISPTPHIIGLAPGTYTVVIQVGECFSEPFEFIVPELPEPIEAEVEVTDVLCFGEANGTALVTVNGGTAPYHLSWEGLDEPVVIEEEGGSYLITGLAAGTYTIVIVDHNECIAAVSFMIDESELLTVEQDNGEIICFEGTTWVSLDIQGGVAPYLLSDNNSDFELEIDTTGELVLAGFAFGDYSWTVTDANNCAVLVEFFLEQPEELMAEVSYEPILCNGELTDVTVTASGGVGPYKLYNMEVSEENLVIASFYPEVTLDGLGAGAYLWFVVDANGCEFELSFIITEPDVFEADVFQGEILCYNGVTTALVVCSGGTSPYSLFDGENLVATFDDEFLVESLMFGLYTWTVTDANNCELITLEFELVNPDEIVVEVETIVHATCYGYDDGEIHVSATGGTGMLTYSLNGGEPQESGSFQGLTAGTYEVTVTDENGCTEIVEVELTEPGELIIDVFLIEPADFGENNGKIWANIYGGTAPYNICLFTECYDNGDDGDFHKSQGVMYWGLQPGEWMIKVVDANGCIAYVCVEVPELGGDDDKIDDDMLTDQNTSVSDQVGLVAFPNPFRNFAAIEFMPQSSQNVTLEVYNLIGERVELLFQGHVNAFEKQSHVFRPAGLPNGIYYVRLTMDDIVYFNKVVLAR